MNTITPLQHVVTWQPKVLKGSDFGARRAAAEEFNAGSRWRKRGLAAIPTKFGISFTTKFLNQAGALVHSELLPFSKVT